MRKELMPLASLQTSTVHSCCLRPGCQGLWGSTAQGWELRLPAELGHADTYSLRNIAQALDMQELMERNPDSSIKSVNLEL